MGSPKAIGQFTIVDFNDINIQTTAPSSPVVNQLWLDTSLTPNQLKKWDGSAWVIVNEVRVGGRNLLPSKPTNGSVSMSSNSVSGYGVKFSVGDNGANWKGWTGLTLKQNLDYTVSFVAWTSANSKPISVDLFPDTLPETSFTITTTPTKYVWTLKSSSSDMSACSLRFFRGGYTFAEDMYITDVKMEIGITPTDWSPSVQETESRITDLETFQTSAQQKITADSIIGTVQKAMMSSTQEETDVDDSDSNIIYSGTGWTSVTNATGDKNLTLSYSSTVGDSAEYSFVGTGIEVFDSGDVNRGQVSITIDNGAATTYDCYTSSKTQQRQLYSVTNLSYGKHVIKITILSTKNTSSTGNIFALDYFTILNSTAFNASNFSSKIAQNADSITSTVSKSVIASSQEVTIVDDSDTAIQYVGTFDTSTYVQYYNTTRHMSKTANDYIQYSFIGTGINVFTTKSSDSGIMKVFIDGVDKGDIDLYVATAVFKQKTYSITGLTYGEHDIKILIKGTKNASSTDTWVAFDYFEILNSSAVNAANIASQINQTAQSVSINASKINLAGQVTISAFDTTTRDVISNGDSSIINPNPYFLDWMGVSPAGYLENGSASISKATSGNGGGNALKYVVPAATNLFLTGTTMTNQPYYQYLVVESTFMLESGTLDGAGILLRVEATTDIDNKLHFKDMITPTLSKYYTVTKTIKLAATSPAGFSGYTVYPMGGYSGFIAQASITAKTIYFDSVKVRAATEQEINAYESSATLGTNATNWTTAYTDTNNWKTAGKTTINGGKIETQTITTNQLLVGNFANLVENGGFENDTAGWGGLGANATIVTTSPYAGTKCLKITANSAINDITNSTNLIEVQAGEKYYVEAWIKSDTGTNGSAYPCALWVFNKDKAVLSYQAPITVTGYIQNWTKYSGIVTMPTGSCYARPWVSVRSDNTAGAFYFDEVVVRRMTTGELIVDGSIGANHIQANSISADKLLVGSGEVATGNLITSSVTITTDAMFATTTSAASIAGANTLTLSDVTALGVDHHLSIGTEWKIITAVNTTTKVVTLSSTLVSAYASGTLVRTAGYKFVYDGARAVGASYCSFGTGGRNNNSAEGNYLQVDLGKSYRISESRIYFYSQDTRYYYYKIAYTDDTSVGSSTIWNYAVGNGSNTGWVTSAPSVSGRPSTNPTIDKFSIPISARFIRIYGNGNSANPGNHLYEWELMSTPVTEIDGGMIKTGTIIADQLHSSVGSALDVSSNSYVKIAVGKIGGDNLVRNGRFDLGLTNWSAGNGSTLEFVADTTSWNQFKVNGVMWKNTTTSENFCIQRGIKVKPNTEYTLGFTMYIDSYVKDVDVYIIGSASDDLAYTYQHCAAAAIRPANPTRYTYTFTTGSSENYVFLRFDNNGYVTNNTTGNAVLLTEVKLEEGENATAWSPNSNEIKTTSVTIDTTGLTVNHSNVGTITKMSADGFKIVNSNGDEIGSLATQSGLTILSADKIYANNVMQVDNVARTYYVNYSNGSVGNDNNAGTSVSPFATITKALNALKTYGMLKAANVTNYIYVYGTVTDNVVIEDFYGGQIAIYFAATATLKGRILVNNCTTMVTLDGARSSYNTTDGCLILNSAQDTTAVYAFNSKYVYVNGFRITNKGGHGVGMYKTSAYIKYCDINYCNSGTWASAITANGSCSVAVLDCCGSNNYMSLRSDEGATINCGYQVAGTGTTIWYPNSTADNWATGGYVNLVGATTKHDSFYTYTPPTTKVYENTWSATQTRSWRSSGWRTDTTAVYQGDYGYGNHKGCMTWDMAGIRSAISGATIHSVQLRLVRQGSGGSSAAGTVHLWGHQLSSIPSSGSTEPSLNKDYGDIGTWAWGTDQWVTLSNSVGTDIRDSVIQGLALYESDGNPYLIFNGGYQLYIKYEK